MNQIENFFESVADSIGNFFSKKPEKDQSNANLTNLEKYPKQQQEQTNILKSEIITNDKQINESKKKC